ncbi:M14 family metallopeptidase [Saprospiraceae bacterium]|nr:M14 family metallopeptidase [Saprospiraceae bacterium]
MNYLKNIALFIFLISMVACKSRYMPQTFNFPEPKDTHSKPIEVQEKQTYNVGTVYASNEFDGARLNDFTQINDNTYRATITPENEPINESAYFCFDIWSDKEKEITLELYYPDHEHRYIPKLSTDAIQWSRMDTTLFDTLKGPDLASLKITISSQKQYVCGQELSNTSHNREWSKTLANEYPHVRLSTIGQSTMDRPLLCLDVYKDEPDDKPTIIIMSRLHPPEVSGYMAMQSYIETILDTSILSKAFLNNYRILIYPMVNPDGVDMGHWRHNAGGIDLNRDWSHYRQKEIQVITQHIVREVRSNNNEVLLGLDFHSTQEDILYTMTDNRPSSIHGFKDIWVQGLKDALPGHDPFDDPYDLNSPISKWWFYLEFGGEGITYEVGDETDRDFVRKKAKVAAIEMMKLLVLRK